MTKVTENRSEKSQLFQGDYAVMDEKLRQQIAVKAYELHERRGRVHGHDLQDWFEAERLVLTELGSQRKRPFKPGSQRRQGK